MNGKEVMRSRNSAGSWRVAARRVLLEAPGVRSGRFAVRCG